MGTQKYVLIKLLTEPTQVLYISCCHLSSLTASSQILLLVCTNSVNLEGKIAYAFACTRKYSVIPMCLVTHSTWCEEIAMPSITRMQQTRPSAS